MEIWRKFYPVAIRWLSPAEGRSCEIPSVGCKYYPLIVMDQDVDRKFWWSTEIIVAGRKCDSWNPTELSMLFNEGEEALKMQARFIKGNTFKLYEGPKLVAVGKFLANEPCRIEYV